MTEKRGSQTLTLDKAEATVRELEAALDKHRTWIKQYQETLVCRTQPRPKDLKKDSYARSAFGKWYATTQNDYIRDHPNFAAVGRNHRRMHTVARAMARRVRDGKQVPQARYREFVVAVDKFKLSVRELLIEARDMLRFMDSLTGVANRFVMLPRLEQERERVERMAEACSVGMMDLDRFKAVNDTWGHHMGDRVLKAAARYLVNNLRRYDEVFRYGGEEFVILMPDTPPDKAKRILDRVRRGLAKEAIELDGTAITVTASFGVAGLEADLAVKACIDRADKAMYRSKQDGRNRVTVWSENGT